MSRVRIGIRIDKSRDSEGGEMLAATMPMAVIFDPSFNAKELQEQLKLFEKDYISLLDSLKAVLYAIRSGKSNRKALLYWDLGDQIEAYVARNSEGQLFLDGVTKHLSRDLSISATFIKRCRRFRTKYSNKTEIDPAIPWTKYRETLYGPPLGGP